MVISASPRNIKSKNITSSVPHFITSIPRRIHSKARRRSASRALASRILIMARSQRANLSGPRCPRLVLDVSIAFWETLAPTEVPKQNPYLEGSVESVRWAGRLNPLERCQLVPAQCLSWLTIKSTVASNVSDETGTGDLVISCKKKKTITISGLVTRVRILNLPRGCVADHSIP